MVLLLGSSIISPVIKGSAIFNFAKFLLVSRGSVFPTWKKLPLLWLTVIFSKRRSPSLPRQKNAPSLRSKLHSLVPSFFERFRGRPWADERDELEKTWRSFPIVYFSPFAQLGKETFVSRPARWTKRESRERGKKKNGNISVQPWKRHRKERAAIGNTLEYIWIDSGRSPNASLKSVCRNRLAKSRRGWK